LYVVQGFAFARDFPASQLRQAPVFVVTSMLFGGFFIGSK
jgi:hypothetical protein